MSNITEEPLKEAADECLRRESNEEHDTVSESMAAKQSEVSAADPLALAIEENIVEGEDVHGDFEWESESEDSDLESEDEEWDSKPEPPARRPKTGTESEGIEDTSSPVEAWKGTDEEDIEPETPQFRPACTPGAQLLNGISYTVLELFQSFLTTSILETVVINTNKYGQKHHGTNWRKITLKDFYSYLSMLIYMGLLKLRSLDDYWSMSRLYQFPFPTTVMSGRKFQLIATSIQMSDPEDDAANNKKKGTADYDRLCKIKPMYEEVRQTCKACYHPRQNIAVDERMVKEYMKKQPTRWGFKLFVLADSSNGYTWDFTVFDGKKHLTGKGVGYDTVMHLVTQKGLGTGYKLYVDNFFTSPTLFLDLLEKKIGACGEICSNQLGSLRLKSGQLNKKSPRGCICWIREGPIVFVQWKNTNDVLTCSTIHKAHGEDTIEKKMKDVEGRWAMKSIAVPPAVLDYKNMGCLDLSVPQSGYYNVLHSTNKWYRSFFYHFVDIAIVNAFILHKELASAKGERVMTQTEFRETLVLELRAAGTPSRAAQKAPLSPSEDEYEDHVCPDADTVGAGGADADAGTGGGASTGGGAAASHRPKYFTNDATIGWRPCVLCHRKTPLGCSTCDKPLCFVSGRDCYELWHVQQNQ